ncbi:hypothetical protein R50073_24930 [Maricurvus nonylphenolicus]|uniref:DUF2244 domain-containing protein n=1 Tax=Maricurvus nonylphenolicus TaxID=1008307 RepID=UPI0036F44F29
MVTKLEGRNPQAARVVLEPNSSMSWVGYEMMLFAAFILFCLLSFAFAVAGAWVIIPFIGIELLVLLAVLLLVKRYRDTREVISFAADHILVEKGSEEPEVCWDFTRSNLLLLVFHDATDCLHHVTLCGDQGLVELGDFLAEEDLRSVIETFKQQGLRAKSVSEWCVCQF